MTKNLLALVFVILATASLCADNFTFSRFEIVEDLTIATSTDGDSVIISWAAIPDVTFYKVYFCYEPYGMYELDLSGEFAGASWSAPVPAASRFYYVTAVYAIPDNFIFVEGGIIYPNNGFYTDGLTVSSFYIDQYELTNAAWEAVMSSGGGDSFPQDNVSWFEATVYCNRRSMLEGIAPCYTYNDGTDYGANPDDWPAGWNSSAENSANVSCDWDAFGYRLPSNAEWEYAARGGLDTQGHTYSGSNDLNSVGWYQDNSGWVYHPVGEKNPNELGLHDMSGNLMEWVWEGFSATLRTVRGGGYFSNAEYCSVWYRQDIDNAAGNYGYIGFRISRSGPPDEFVFVEGGTIDPPIGIFTGGLSVSSFFISKNELTVGEYVDVMVADPVKPRQDYDNHPVDCVSWFDALEYCNRRSLREGLTPCYSYLGHGSVPDDWPSGWNSSNANSANVDCDWSAAGYRLPTEAEWEYVAWGGLQANFDLLWVYSGSDVLGEVGWYIDNSGGVTHPVGQLAPNGLGTYDMSGNVLEWCWDVYSGYERVLRGGCVYSMANFCTNYHRFSDDPVAGNSGKGFRICRGAL